jgi:CRISPR/Cas system CMR-associated protein Cmr3 (group 5 of RAMP superfamily)
MRTIKKAIAATLVGIVAILASGCAGMEVGGKVGIYKVDDREEIQTTKSKSKALKCYFVTCDQPYAVEGS